MTPIKQWTPIEEAAGDYIALRLALELATRPDPPGEPDFVKHWKHVSDLIRRSEAALAKLNGLIRELAAIELTPPWEGHGPE